MAGAGARREADRRRARREARVLAEHPLTGRLRMAIGEAPVQERNWSRGGQAEEWIAESLASRTRDEVMFLHDRAVPGSRANIDHIAIAPSGVWVIDAKRYKGRARAVGRGAKQELWINGRNRTSLIEGLEKQLALVRAAADDFCPGVPTHGALCFIDTDLPLFRTLTVRGYPLLWCKAMARRLNVDGPVGVEDARRLAAGLAERFREA